MLSHSKLYKFKVVKSFNDKRATTYLYLMLSVTLLTLGCKSQKVETQDKTSVEIKQTDGFINVMSNDQVLLTYNTKAQLPHDTIPNYYKRSGFIHPITTLKGHLITDGYPTGHTHQHGVFSAWTKTSFRGDTIDFWNQHLENAMVRHKQVIDINEAQLRFSVELEHVARAHGKPTVALTEQWDIEVKHRGSYFIIDWTSTQRCATQDPVNPEKYTYGGFAFRGAKEWNDRFTENATWQFMTDESLDKIEANHSQPGWASMFGKVNGSAVGVALIPHKSNFRYPQHIRVHPTMPYYCFYPAVNQRFSIEPGEEYRTKHRLVVFDGELDAGLVEREKEMYLNQTGL